MKFFAYTLATLLGLLGLAFVIGSRGRPMQIVVGVILLAAAGVLFYFALRPPKTATTTIVQKIELSGDVHLENLTCRACGGALGRESVIVKAGAVFINCQFCGASYQLEEEPKW